MRAAIPLVLGLAMCGGCKEQPPTPVAPSASVVPTAQPTTAPSASVAPKNDYAPPAYGVLRAPRELIDEVEAMVAAEPQLKKLLDACKLSLATIDRIDAALVPPAALEVVVAGKASAEAVTCLLDIVLPQYEPKVVASKEGVRITTAPNHAEDTKRALALLDAQPKADAYLAARLGARPPWRLEMTTRGEALSLSLSSTPAAVDAFHQWWRAAVAEKKALVPALKEIRIQKTGGTLDVSFEGEGWEDVETSTQRALLLRQHVAESFRVPSGSMLPTIAIGDHFFVDKTGRGPARGDVIVFPLPENQTQQFVKRLIAAPGDRLEVLDGRPIVNGLLLPQCAVGKMTLTEDGKPQHVYLEYLGEQRYLTAYDDEPTAKTCKRDADCGGAARCHVGHCGVYGGPWVAKAGEAWVMGDNRDNSYDSRAFDGGRGRGIALDTVVGRARYRYFHPTDLSRAFTSIDEVILDGAEAATKARLKRCLDRPPTKSARRPPAP